MEPPTTLTDSPPPRKRQRARKACLPCRQRKRKCDNEFPCCMCTTYGYICQYALDDGPTAAFTEKSGSSHPHQVTNRERRKPSSNTASHRSALLGSGRASSVSGSISTPSDLGLLDPAKERYQGSHGVTAFPRSLGLDFQSKDPPRVHSFAYNCGIRAEMGGSAHADLRGIVTKEEFERFAKVYFETVQPLFSAVDEQAVVQRAERFWVEPGATSIFEAILAGIAALGSFFSAHNGHPREAELLLHAKGILDDPTFQPTLDLVSAWMLRTIYLRSTTRPHITWLASCTTMHLAEAAGMHHEIGKLFLTESHARDVQGHTSCETVRRIFWTVWRANVICAYEYGRSAVTLSSITCEKPRFGPDDPSGCLQAIIDLVPQDKEEGKEEDLHDMLEKVGLIPVTHPFVSMTKADFCMSLYRHHRLLKSHVDRVDVLDIIAIGSQAIAAALGYAREGKFYWNVLCTVFQFVCVLLALDTVDSLGSVKGAMEVLEQIAGLLGTHLAKEAVTTARVLLRDSMRKKRVEVGLLEKADGGRDEEERGDGEEDGKREVVVEQGLGMDIDWDMLLDPWYMSNFSTMACMGETYPGVGEYTGGSNVSGA